MQYKTSTACDIESTRIITDLCPSRGGRVQRRQVICDIFMIAGQVNCRCATPVCWRRHPLGGGATSRISNDLVLHLFLRICSLLNHPKSWKAISKTVRTIHGKHQGKELYGNCRLSLGCIKQRSPTIFMIGLPKNGSCLLSHLVGQYHRRWRA